MAETLSRALAAQGMRVLCGKAWRGARRFGSAGRRAGW